MSKLQSLEPQTIEAGHLHELLQNGTLLLTANKRQAAWYRQRYDQAMMAAGRQAWDTPQILPWQAWLQSLWQDSVIMAGQSQPLLLSAIQEQYLWKNIVRQSLEDNPLQQVNATVRKLRQAWQLIQQWSLPLQEKTFSQNHDTRAFYRWAQAFHRHCRQNHWISMDELGEVLRRSATRLPVIPSLALIGFSRIAPQQQALLQQFAGQGSEVSWLQPAGQPAASAGKLACADAGEEMEMMARWARQCLEENAAARIGIVVPDLGAQRESLHVHLEQVLLSARTLPGQADMDSTRPWNISLGSALSQYPVVSDALLVLGLLKQKLALADVSRLLASPFIAGWEEEQGARALLEQRLQSSGEPQTSLKSLIYFAAQQERGWHCPQLLKCLKAVDEYLAEMPSRLSAGQWPAQFSRVLKLGGWAAGRSLNSEEYQAANAWQELLSQLAGLEPVAKLQAGAGMSAGEALAQCRLMADERIFQPESGDAPIQVLGLLEAEALQFDSLWVCGLHDNAWPPAARPNPFLPLAWQREQRLPGCSEQAVLTQAQQMMQSWLQSAQEVVFSYPCRDGEAELAGSALLAQTSTTRIHEISRDELNAWQGEGLGLSIHRQNGLQERIEDPAPPLPAGSEAVSGGSQVFTLQAACPFRAFAERRLGACGLQKAEIGLNALVRGSLLHEIMDRLWQRLRDQQRLLDLPETELQQEVEDCVDSVLTQFSRYYAQTLRGRFREIEKQRLLRQIDDWLAVEKQRPSFRVLEREEKYPLRAGGISVTIKIDRVDVLADGSRVLIDYKTGQVNTASWFGERPDEPQLPLYSMAVEGDIAAICFARIRAGDCGFQGISAEAELLPAVKDYSKVSQSRDFESWQQLLQYWQMVMENLGREFRQGRADVSPKGPQSCEYCELGPLCRINEKTLLEEAGRLAGATEPET